MMEEYRVPDGMVGLSEYIHTHFLNYTNDACNVIHIQIKI